MTEEITFEKKIEAERQLKDLQNEIDYDIRDFPIGYIVSQYQSGQYFVPDYQRAFVWDSNRCVRFIESILLGLPIPFMFFSDTENGKLEIVDGAQRVQTIVSFTENKLMLSGLKKLTTLNGFYYEDLPISQKRKFESKAMRLIILQDGTSTSIRQEIFNRINTSSLKLEDSEIRKGAYDSEFMKFILKCTENDDFKEIAPTTEGRQNRGENMELIIRFLLILIDI